MRKIAFNIAVIMLLFCFPVLAKDTYRIEVLQVSKINPFDWSYEGFLEGLAKNGIVKGKNLTINRRIIDADADAGIWKKVGILMKIKSEASDMVASKPDLVLTISTPATKYSKDKIISSGIPVVFTGVAVPQAVGCASVSKAGPGFTGASLYMDPTNAFKVTKLALPKMTVMGIVHSDDDNAIAFVEEAKAKAKALGITIISRQVGKSENPKAAVQDLISKGAQAFGIPIDAYFALRNYQPLKDLFEVTNAANIPVISYCHVGFSGGVLYVGSEFEKIGELSGIQAAKILKEGTRPESLPIAIQEDLKILVDLKAAKRMGIELPMGILQIAKSVDTGRK